MQPTAEVLNRILAVRLHLDQSVPDNGPLRVVPGSHKHGRLSSEQVSAYQKDGSVVCTVPQGGALLMRPLLLHASSAWAVAMPRRVVHRNLQLMNCLKGWNGLTESSLRRNKPCPSSLPNLRAG